MLYVIFRGQQLVQPAKIMNTSFNRLFFLLLINLPGTAFAAEVPDFEREQRLASEYVDAIVVGDAVELNDGERDFMGVMTEAETDKPKGAVLIMHGRGYHPAWPTVIQPLRTMLPEQGWSTLSIQLPVLGKDAKYFDYLPIFSFAYPRIRAAIQYLREAGYERVIVLAHSCGAHMMMSYIHKNGDKEFDGYISVGSGATDYKQPMKEEFPFAGMKVPVLDIYGSNDFPAVLRMAGKRASLIKQGGNAKSAQVVVDGADHYYMKQADVEKLGAEIVKWLNTL
jgi:acetyl esterase/lipase